MFLALMITDSPSETVSPQKYLSNLIRICYHSNKRVTMANTMRKYLEGGAEDLYKEIMTPTSPITGETCMSPQVDLT